MIYEVKEWVYDNPCSQCNFISVVEITPAIKQAIINDIRKNGYIFDEGSGMCPVLNSGEIVKLDYEICKELVCEAYGFDEKQYKEYLEIVPNIPPLSDNRKYKCDYQMKKIVWVKDESFNKLKTEILDGSNNVEIIPANYIVSKTNDIIVFMTENKDKYFEVTVKKYLSENSLKIADIKKMQEVDITDIINMTSSNEKHNNVENILYRYNGFSGEEVYNNFKNFYENGLFSLFSFDEFDCNIDIVIFDKNVEFERTILDKPEDRPLDEETRQKINDAYNKVIQEEQEEIKQKKEKYLKFKKEFYAKKNETDSINIEKIPFITLDNISNYFSSQESEDTVETLIEKATTEYELALKNEISEKKEMLLNNVCIYFDKIIDKEGTIPLTLFINTKGNLLNIHISKNSNEKVNKIINEIKDFYTSSSDSEKKENEIKYGTILFDYATYLNNINNFKELFATINIILELLDDNETDESLLITSRCYSLLGSIYFEAKMYDQAIEYAFNALVMTNQIQNKTSTTDNQYAIYAFNLGNIYFQSDHYDNAIKLFTLAIDFAKTQVFASKFLVFKTASDYLAQVYVCKKQYQKAIEEYLSASTYITEVFSGEIVQKTNIDFLERIALIYKEFLENPEAANRYNKEAEKLKKLTK